MLPFFRRLLLGALLISDYLEQKDYNLLFMVMTIQQFNSNANASGSGVLSNTKLDTETSRTRSDKGVQKTC